MIKFSSLQIDGDALIVMAAAMAEERSVDVYVDSQALNFPTMTDAKKAGYGGPYIYKSEPATTKTAYIIVHNMLNKWIKMFSCSDLRIYFSDDVRNLHRTSYYPPYKIGRAGKSKPMHTGNLRSYLMGRYGGIMEKGLEADDLLGIYKTPTSLTISHDKDIAQFPGWHYNIIKDLLIEVTDPGQLIISKDRKKLLGTGFKFFCALAIAGDTCDGIPGAKGCGQVAAYDILTHCKTNKQCLDTVTALYTFKEQDDLKIMLDLVWIPRGDENNHYSSWV